LGSSVFKWEDFKVKSTAVGLARDGRLHILRHGKPVDPNGFKGVYRLRLP
jgi:hypothetical protein